MKKLYLIRHSLANEAYRGQADRDRDLTESGAVRAMQLADYLKAQQIFPQAILTSQAQRAIRTAGYLSERLLPSEQEASIHEDLYESSVRLMVKLINELDESWESVMLVGHNPILIYTAEYLTGEEVAGLEPGGVLKLTAENQNWAEISGKTMDLESFINPDQYAMV